MDEQVKEKETAKESSMLFWVKLQTCLTGAVLVLLLIVGIFAAVQVGHVMRMFRGVDVEKINATVLTLQSAAEELDMETINKAVDSLKALWQEGRPRRRSSLSMQGRSSWINE